MTNSPSLRRSAAGTPGTPGTAGPLAGCVVSGGSVTGGWATTAHAVCAEHLVQLGAEQRSTSGTEHPDRIEAGPVLLPPGETRPITVDIDWRAPGGTPFDEPTAQAAYGLMAVHGRAGGALARLGVDYVSTAAGVIATQGALAGYLAGLRGRPTSAVSVSVAGAALLTVSQYLAAGSATDPEERETAGPVGHPPPFTSADGIRFELETLDPEPWRRFWTALGADPAVAGRGWRAFVLRYANAGAPLPAQLHELLRQLPFARLVELARESNVAVQPLRTHQERLADLGPDGRFAPPWTVRPLAGAVPVPVPETGVPAPGDGPLAGLTVVEAGRRVQGPLAGQVLRLLGAEIIRIEPAGGDPLRGMPPMVGDCSARFLALNRGKRIVEVDLRSPAGRKTVFDAVAGADAFLHNWAPGKAAGFGLDSADFAEVNPGLVYAYASGWGDARGADAPPGTDFMAQAYAGLAEHLRPLGTEPAGSLMTLLDVLGGLVCAEGVLAGLVARHRTGHGQRVDSSLLSAAGVLQGPLIAAGRHRPVWGPLDVPVPVADGHLVFAGGTTAEAVRIATATPDLDTALRALGGLPAATARELLAAAGVTAVTASPEPGLLATDPLVTDLLDIDGCAFVRSPWRFVS